MFYLLFCGLILSIEVVCFILYMLPLVTIELTPYSELLGSYTEESYTMIDYLGESYSIFSFSFTILSIVFITILLINSLRVYTCKSKGIKASLVLNIVTTVILIVQLLFFIRFKNNTSYASGMTSNFYYYYYRHQTGSVIAIAIMFISSLIISLLMITILIIYNSSNRLRQKKFFSLIGERSKSETIEGNTAINDTREKLDNIEVLIKLNQLRKEGAITEEEYNNKKKEIL